ncbi:protein-tyrosine-phosphatase, partial [Pseudomonas sp. GW460-13]
MIKWLQRAGCLPAHAVVPQAPDAASDQGRHDLAFDTISNARDLGGLA